MMRKHKIIALALALVLVLSVTGIALATYVYESRYGHNTLKRGHEGTYVFNLQVDVNEAGHSSCGTADGIFGSQTEIGVRGYQSYHGLSVDGQAGYNTKTTLWYEEGQFN